MERGKKNGRNVGDGLRIKKYNQEKRKEKLWIHETRREEEAKKDIPTGPARLFLWLPFHVILTRLLSTATSTILLFPCVLWTECAWASHKISLVRPVTLIHDRRAITNPSRTHTKQRPEYGGWCRARFFPLPLLRMGKKGIDSFQWLLR